MLERFICSLIFLLVGVYAVLFVIFRLNPVFNKEKSISLIWGSGGHTTELLIIMKKYDFSQHDKINFIISATDRTSRPKIKDYIQRHEMNIKEDQVRWIVIPRSREVKQSYITSVPTTLYSILMTFFKLLRIPAPQVLVSNGPGVCIPVFFFYLVRRFLFLEFRKTQLIFVESFARVSHLSLSGQILYSLVDS